MNEIYKNKCFKASKFQAAGNDFVLINNMEEKLDEKVLPELAKKICHRRFSMGADGLILVDKAIGKDTDFRMVFLNADGTYGEMCGNGARSIARFAHEEGIAGVSMVFDTLAGPVSAVRLDENTYKIKLNRVSVYKKAMEVKIGDVVYTGDYIELGEPGLPHFVLELKDLEPELSRELFNLGRALRYAPEFPKGANINFYKMTDTNELKAITYERGVEDFTYACGTGAGSMAYSVKQGNKIDGDKVSIKVPGGVLTIELEDKVLYLTGDVKRVYDTSLNLDAVLNSQPK
ncbi:MAG: diaminopimelate epimerase [Clostridiaceae bacterium]